MFATAGGGAEAYDFLALCGCWFGLFVVAVLALVGVARQSYWFAGIALFVAVYQAAMVTFEFIKFKPSDDPDEAHQEGLMWQLVFWAAVQVVIAVAALVGVVVRRQKPLPPAPPNRFADTSSPEGATGNSQG